MQSVKWLKLSPTQFTEIPDIQFSIKKPFFTASVVLTYRKNAAGEVIGFAELSAKIPIKGKIGFAIEVQSSRGASGLFAFQKCVERDEVFGNARELTAREQTLTLSKTTPAGPLTSTREISESLPAPLLVHLLALPAFIQTRSDDSQTYAAIFANGLKFQFLRLERVAQSGTKESYVGRVLSSSDSVTEEEFFNLPWSTAKSFEFDFDTEKKTLTAARATLPLVGRLEIK